MPRQSALPVALILLLTGCWQSTYVAPLPPADAALPPADAALPPDSPAPEEIPTRERIGATLLSVTDGDTVRVWVGETMERVRLIGIDTPETEFSPGGPEPFADEATEALQELLPEGDPVELEFDVEPRDRYGRMLAYVYAADGTFANAAMLEQGWARALTVAPNVAYAETFFRLASEAREAGLGIWAEP